MSKSPDQPDAFTGPETRPEIDAVLPLVYEELRNVASSYFRREGDGHTLQPTALVHEAYVRMAQGGTLPMADRRQFLAVAARAIRQVLVDHARGKHARKRGGDWRRITLNPDLTPGHERVLDVLAIDEAITRLAELSARQARVVELRFFAGMKDDEIADVLDVSPRTVRGDWQVARAWLKRELWERMTHGGPGPTRARFGPLPSRAQPSRGRARRLSPIRESG